MEKAVTRLDFHPSVLLLFFFVIQHLVDKTQDKLLISSAALCNKPFNPVRYFLIRNCTRSQYLVKRRSNGKNQPDQNIQTWFSPVIFYCRGYGDAVIFRDEADRICDCPHADTLPDSGAADSAALRSLLDRLWLLLAAIVAHVPMESGKNGASFSAILYDTSDSRSRLRSESGEHCGAVPEYRTAYKTIIQKIS